MDSKMIRRFRIAQFIVALVLISIPLIGGAQVEFEESFDSFPPPQVKWNFCQAARFLNFPTAGEHGRFGAAYRIGIDGFRGTAGCVCGKPEGCLGLSLKDLEYYSEPMESDEESELYPVLNLPKAGISLFQKLADMQCDNYDESRVYEKNLAQKNEIRLWKDDWPLAKEGHWISFKFKIDGKIDRCGSMRWVGGQIKASDDGKSPVIAQRFDNGVFHITIETPKRAKGGNKKKTRRFIVAKAADGHPDAGSDLQPVNKGKNKHTCDLTEKDIVSSDCQYGGIVHKSPRILPSVSEGQWVQMDYYIKLEKACKRINYKKCKRQLDIWADGEEIATVKGNFGSDEAHKHQLKFKFGVYRDLQAGDAGIVIDHFTLRRDPEQKWCPNTREYSDTGCGSKGSDN